MIFSVQNQNERKIRNKFNADCIEMEGSAIAQVCKLDKIPFLVVRSISDKPNGQNEITFDKFLEKASRRCAYIINEFLHTNKKVCFIISLFFTKISRKNFNKLLYKK